MRPLLFALAILSVAPAYAAECVAFNTSFTAEDISGGVVTTDAIGVAAFAQLILRADLTDANNGVTNLQFSFTESGTSGGTFRNVGGDCLGRNPLVCAPLKINWNPSSNGKNFALPIPGGMQWIKIAVTPTGHGAGDTLALAMLGCDQPSPWLLQVADTTTTEGACVYPAGGWTKIDCSNTSAASSAQLVASSRYVIQCGDDSYLATGTAAGQNANGDDGWLPLGAWLEFATTATVRYISCLNKNSNSDCRYMECQ